ncbi:chitin-binding type-2 domain-containing protein [Caerostris extrusa]|uniref:Chitin-binding type-2 domain-containing protein n=1 Tax=Caerostris extrusa TaxID=172846 RepID=A0AAV4PYK6_CAEEX|nr:chitin-binding type-2 domain-containing protein [Caerostris extrusa]
MYTGAGIPFVLSGVPDFTQLAIWDYLLIQNWNFPKPDSALQEQKFTEVTTPDIETDCRVYGDPPTYSEWDMPETGFTCQDKVHGGYYADIETYCQMYHVCHRSKDRIMKDTKFLCTNGTVFDQRHLVCQDYRKVPYCGESEKYYRIVRTLLKRLEG